MSTLQRVIELARMAHKRPELVGVLSTGEHCAVALLCNNAAFLPRGYTFLDAVDRLGEEWLKACLDANRIGWMEQS